MDLQEADAPQRQNQIAEILSQDVKLIIER